MNGRIIQHAKLISVICIVHVICVTCMCMGWYLCSTCVTSMSHGRIIQHEKLTSVICIVHVTCVTCMCMGWYLCSTCVTSMSHINDAHVHVYARHTCTISFDNSTKVFFITFSHIVSVKRSLSSFAANHISVITETYHRSIITPVNQINSSGIASHSLVI